MSPTTKEYKPPHSQCLISRRTSTEVHRAAFAYTSADFGLGTLVAVSQVDSSLKMHVGNRYQQRVSKSMSSCVAAPHAQSPPCSQTLILALQPKVFGAETDEAIVVCFFWCCRITHPAGEKQACSILFSYFPPCMSSLLEAARMLQLQYLPNEL